MSVELVDSHPSAGTNSGLHASNVLEFPEAAVLSDERFAEEGVVYPADSRPTPDGTGD